MPLVEEEIKALEEELKTTKYNKATQHHVGLVKAKLARLREKLETAGKGKGAAYGYSVKKTGDATAILVGFPSVGKSTILNCLTSAKSKIADYEFTTLSVIPGMLEHKHAKIQLLDVPGMITGAASGKGRGREVLSVVRSCDMVIFVIDAFRPAQLDFLTRELYSAGIRLDEKKPEVEIKKNEKGGIVIIESVKQTKLELKTIESILREYKLSNAEIRLKGDLSAERFIDAVIGNRIFLPSIVIVNKIDLASAEQLAAAQKYVRSVKPNAKIVPVSAEKGAGMELLKDSIFEALSLYRIYLKEIGKKADDEPLIMKHKPTIQDVCIKIHKDFIAKFRFAKVWGKSAKFPGQKFALKHELADSDILEIHLR